MIDRVVACLALSLVGLHAACIDVDPAWTFGGGDAGAGGPGGAASVGYVDVVLADAPLAYWRLGDTSGAIAADELGARDGIVTLGSGSQAWGTKGAIAGDADTATTLTDGAAITLAVAGELAFAGVVPYSLEGWVSAESGTTHVACSSAFVADPGYSTEIDDAFSSLEHERRDDETSVDEIWDAPPAESGFHHVVVTFDGTTVRVYFDGLPASASGTEASFAVPDPGLPWLIADTSSPGEASFDEVAVYDHVLSIDRVDLHFRCGKTGDCR